MRRERRWGRVGPLVAGTTVTSNLGGAGGAAATCNAGCKLSVAGTPGGPGIRWSGTLVNPGVGGSSVFAGGGQVVSQGQTAGVAGGGCGAGASGAGSTSTTATTGGTGSAGCIRITEFK